MREYQVRFRERLRVKLLLPTRQFYTSPCTPAKTPENTIKPSPVIPYAEVINEPIPGKFPTQNFTQMGNFETENKPNSQTQSPDSHEANSQIPNATCPKPTGNGPQYQYYMTLPADQRPSPFKEGNIIWISYLDDLEYPVNNFGSPWGEIKMGDYIRHYPDMYKPGSWI